MRNSSEKIHTNFIDIALEFAPALADALVRAGPVEFKPDDSLPLPHHLCRSVAGQQLSVTSARTIWGRVIEAAGELPLVEFFVEENTEVLRKCGLSAAKVRTMCGIAKEARAGNLRANELRMMNHKERSGRLTLLWGVGQWTADMISIFYFGDEDVWPDGDLAARKTLARLTSPRRKTVRTAERFAPHRSWLALYMWQYLDAVPNQ